MTVTCPWCGCAHEDVRAEAIANAADSDSGNMETLVECDEGESKYSVDVYIRVDVIAEEWDDEWVDE